MRTLGLAYKFIPEDSGNDCAELVNEGNMIFLGIVAISDPIRPDVPEAVQKCQSAGIGVKIVTGDTPGTATEIARQIGLWKPEDTDRNRITGVEFAALSDEEALDRVLDLKVMSRARPMDKQRLVQLLQQKRSRSSSNRRRNKRCSCTESRSSRSFYGNRYVSSQGSK